MGTSLLQDPQIVLQTIASEARDFPPTEPSLPVENENIGGMAEETSPSRLQEEESHSLEAYTLYEDNIHPGDTVISIGPNGHIWRDPSLLLAAHQLGTDGRLLIADPQYEMLGADEYDAAIEKAGSPITGYGSVKAHLEELSSLRSMGVPLATPEWLGERCTAQNLRNPDGTPIEDGSIDVIVDRDTSPFVISQWGTGMIDDPNALQRIYDGYARVLRAGGRVILQVDTSTYHTPDGQELNYRDMLERAGLAVEVHQVDSTFQIPVDEASYSRIASSHGENRQFLERTPGGSGVLRIAERDTATVFVARKVASPAPQI